MRRAGKSDAVRRMTQKDKRTAVVCAISVWFGCRRRSAADVSLAKAALRRAVYCGKNERIRTGKIRAAGGAAGRAEDTSGKRRAYFYRQIRRQIYVARAYEIRAERQNKEPCARQWRKDREEALRTDKNGREKSKPRVRGSVCADGNGELRENR